MTSSESRAHGLGGARTAALLCLTMVAFAANSVLCRKALAQCAIDPATFTLVRLASGAAMLSLLIRLKGGATAARIGGTWLGAFTLIAYAVSFSFAYLSLASGTGALLLFGAVQVTMIVRGLVNGERLTPVQWTGLGLAFAGLIILTAPGVTAPPPLGALLMIVAGVGWGAYSLLGRSSTTGPLASNAGNFLRATPLAAAVTAIMAFTHHGSIDGPGLAYAVASGAIASGLGYALWYATLPHLTAAVAASVQLSVPIITAVGGALTLGEAITLRLTLASLAVLGGIALVVQARIRQMRGYK